VPTAHCKPAHRHNNLAAQHGTDLDGQISQNRDADIAQTITQLKAGANRLLAGPPERFLNPQSFLLNYLH